MTEFVPADIPGVSWKVTSEGRDRIRVTGRMILREVAEAQVWIRESAPGEFLAVFSGWVKPGWTRRGIGLALVGWAEAVARARVSALGGRRVTLAVDRTRATEGERALFAATGLALTVVEEEMRRPVSLGMIPAPLPAGVSLLPWSDETALPFFDAYRASFRDRPGFPDWPVARWRMTYASGLGFRPDLSMVAVAADGPAGFAVLWVDGEVAWIVQMGVVPAWRGRKLGESLLAEARKLVALEGLEWLALDVADDNGPARALFGRTGFRVTGRYESWRKVLDA